MKVFNRVDGAVCGAILSTRPLATQAAASSHTKVRDERPSWAAPASQTRRCFTRDARANGVLQCPQTASWLVSTFLPANPRRRPRPANCNDLPCRRQTNQRYSSQPATAAESTEETPSSEHPAKRSNILSTEELLDFVKRGGARTVEEHLKSIGNSFIQEDAQPEPASLTSSEGREASKYPLAKEALNGKESFATVVEELETALRIRYREPAKISLDHLFNLYSALPEPRMMCIPSHIRRGLLENLGRPSKRNSISMLRYFSLLGDARDCGLPLRRGEWNNALSLASRYVAKTTVAELESAMVLWNEMEKKDNVKSNGVTFNILFDVASKAGNFTLAEALYKEMALRKIPFTRYHHVSLIHFFGLKKDAAGVRAAYKEMVRDGEMIDTVVLNCLISSFLRCGKQEEALRVYKHMRNTNWKASGIPGRNCSKGKAVTDVLMAFARVGKAMPELWNQLQQTAPTAPDLQTFRALIYWFAVKLGDIHQVAELLDDMRWFQVPLHGSIFLTLFKGFRRHGARLASDSGRKGKRSEWSPHRLSKVYEALIATLDDKNQSVYLDTWLVMWTLSAFDKCTTLTTVVEVYQQLEVKWDLEPDRIEFLDAWVDDLIAGNEPNINLTEKPYAKKKSLW